MIKIKKYTPIFEIGVLEGFITFVLTFLITFCWNSDGLGLLEFSFLPLIAGFFLFFTVLILNIIYLNKIIKNSFRVSENQRFNKYIMLSIVLVTSVFTYTIIDFLVFLFDDSLPKEYAKGLIEFLRKNGSPTEGMEEFSNLSFGIQNLISNLVSSFIACLLSIPFIKKDGEFFKTKRDF